MSGHSKWHSIKHKKAKADAARGKVFTRVIKELTVAARMGGGDPNGNARLRSAITAAKAANMPADNIDRAIKKGTGELPGVTYEELTYEGYGPCGVALMIDIMTDNKNRTVAEIRHLMTKYGGNLGASGCVAYMFRKKGAIAVEKSAANEDALMELVLEAGADDMTSDEEQYDISTPPAKLEAVRAAIEAKGIPMLSAELTMVADVNVKVTGKDVEKVMRILDALEEHEDVQNVHSNVDIDQAELEALEE